MKGLPHSATPSPLPDSRAWARVPGKGGPESCSGAFLSLAVKCGSDPVEFAGLFAGTPPGRWPCSIGGRLLDSSIVPLSGEDYLIFSAEISQEDSSSLLDSIRGNRRTLLCTPSGRLIASSSLVKPELEHPVESLQSCFDPGSRPSIQAALNRCRITGRVDEFLVSASRKGERENWSLTMERLPSPGGLVLCDLSTPSVAIVSSGAAAGTLLDSLIEENPSPAIVVDKRGVVTKLNAAARIMARDFLSDAAVVGTHFWKWVTDEYREKAREYHDRRMRGYYAPNRYSVGLDTGPDNPPAVIEISVFPLEEGGDSVAFISKTEDSSRQCVTETAGGETLPGALFDPVEVPSIMGILRACTGARDIALVLSAQTFTSGDPTRLLESLPPDPQERVEEEDSRGEYRVFHPFPEGNALIALGGMPGKGLRPCGELAVRFAGKYLENLDPQKRQKRQRHALERVSMLVELMAKGRGSPEAILGDIAEICSADKAVKAELSSDGTLLLPVSSFGVQGSLPGFSLGSDSILTWVCVHGRSAFLADPLTDVRMSAVFPDSCSEIAAPIIRGDVVTGALLLATSAEEGFQGDSLMLLETAVGILSLLEGGPAAGTGHSPGAVNEELAETVISELEHSLSASSASLLEALEQMGEGVLHETRESGLFHIVREAAGQIGSSTSLLMGWLRASAYGGRPDMKWSDPRDTASSVLATWRKNPAVEGVSFILETPEEAFIACFDPSWLYITLNSLIRSAVELTDPGGRVKVSLAKAIGFWTLQVENSGRGIPASDIPDLFRKGPPGNGRSLSRLDLPLAKNLAEAMGGTITVFSLPGTGTRFLLRFGSS